MQLSIKKYLAIFTFLGGLIYILQKIKFQLPKIINNYLNDLLIVPIVLLLSLLIVRKIRYDKNYTFSIIIIIYIVFMYSFLFEFLFPKYMPRYTADFIDVILYFIGGFCFWVIQKNKKDGL